MSWMLLIAAGVCEMCFTALLKLSAASSKSFLLSGAMLFYMCSFILLAQVVKSIPISVAYPCFTAIGAILTIAVGVVWFGEPLTLLRSCLIVCLLTSAIGLKLL